MELAGCGGNLLMVHLSRLSEEVILWCSWEFKFIELDDALFYWFEYYAAEEKSGYRGAGPWKIRPGLFGDLTTLLTMMKGLPLAYNKDMQEDKEAIFDAVRHACRCA